MQFSEGVRGGIASGDESNDHVGLGKSEVLALHD